MAIARSTCGFQCTLRTQIIQPMIEFEIPSQNNLSAAFRCYLLQWSTTSDEKKDKIKTPNVPFSSGYELNSTINLLTVIGLFISLSRVVKWVNCLRKMSIISLSEEEVANLLTWPLVYDAVEQALRAVPETRTSEAQPTANQPARIVTSTGKGRQARQPILDFSLLYKMNPFHRFVVNNAWFHRKLSTKTYGTGW